MSELEFQIAEVLHGHGGNEIRLAGALTFRQAERLRSELKKLVRLPSVVRVNLSAVETLDGGAAAVLADVWQEALVGGAAMSFVGAKGDVASVLDLYTERAPRACLLPPPARVSLFEQVGRATRDLILILKNVLEFLGEGLSASLAAFRAPRTVNWSSLGRLAERAGADGLPIVLLISFLIGLITAFQAAVQLHKFGADVFLADLVSLSVTRELGPLMTAIVVAGRSGAAIAAEVGTMKVSEEIDAIRTLGLCPIRFLVIPRVLAVALVLPVLTLLSDIVGVIGGLLIAVFKLELTMNSYIMSTRDALEVWDVFGGLIKAAVFGVIIAVIACERGLATRGGAEGVGRSTTSAVVAILFHLIVADAVFTVLFNQFGI